LFSLLSQTSIGFVWFKYSSTQRSQIVPNSAEKKSNSYITVRIELAAKAI